MGVLMCPSSSSEFLLSLLTLRPPEAPVVGRSTTCHEARYPGIDPFDLRADGCPETGDEKEVQLESLLENAARRLTVGGVLEEAP